MAMVIMLNISWIKAIVNLMNSNGHGLAMGAVTDVTVDALNTCFGSMDDMVP